MFIVIVAIYIGGAVFFFKDDVVKCINPQRTKAARGIIRQKEADLSLWIMKHKSSIMDRELYNSSVVLKNLALVRRETPLSADYMIEKIMENSTSLKPVYGEMLTLYRAGRDEDAAKVLALNINSKAAKHFSIILSKLDKMNPAELEAQMQSFQKSMIEKRVTYAVRKVQRNSAILTAFATATIFALLLNFVVVVVFMYTLQSLNSIFI